MFDLLSPYHAFHRHPAPSAYAGPERRGAQSMIWRWLSAALDEIDYGVLVVVDETVVAHANHVARTELDAEHPLQLLGQELRVRRGQDLAPLREALAGAAQRGLRRLLPLGDESHRVNVAVVPLPSMGRDARPATLLVFGKRKVCEELSAQWFARAHGLTGAETRVLEALCAGATPQQIAARQCVAISTVRTQIGCIRAKTGADSIRGLVRQVAVLPPLVSALRSGGANERAAALVQ